MVRGVVCLLLVASVTVASAAAAAPTKAGWAAGANAVCRIELTRLHALPKPTQGDITGTVDYLNRVIEITTPLTKRIAALPRPAAEATPIRQWLSTQWQATTMTAEMRDAVKRNDTARIALVVRQVTALGVRADTLARRLGANVCAQS